MWTNRFLGLLHEAGLAALEVAVEIHEHRMQLCQRQANTFGLYDMLGNVWEWCRDHFDPKVYGAYRVFRGVGFADEARSCRASCRRKSHPTLEIDDIGFRLARSLFSGDPAEPLAAGIDSLTDGTGRLREDEPRPQMMAMPPRR